MDNDNIIAIYMDQIIDLIPDDWETSVHSNPKDEFWEQLTESEYEIKFKMCKEWLSSLTKDQRHKLPRKLAIARLREGIYGKG